MAARLRPVLRPVLTERPRLPRLARLFPFAFAAALVATVAPLWSALHLPAVDAPQHLFLVHVLRALDDPQSPYHATYLSEPRLTYVGFYFGVKWLAALVGVENALRLWLTLVVAGIPLATLALLRTFRRNDWLALLACPLAYTDNFYWGLFSFLSSIPLTLLTVALFVRTLEAERHGWRWAAALAVTLAGLQLTHAAAMVFPAVALPVLLVMTRSERPRRVRALAALVPGVALFLGWLVTGVHQDRTLGVAGEPWKAVAPLFDPRSFVFQPAAARVRNWFSLLGNGFWDWADRPAALGWAVLVGVVAVAGVVSFVRARGPGSPRPDLRPAALLGLAGLAYLALPTDVLGYMYMIHPRYAQLSALLLLPVLTLPTGLISSLFAPAATALALYSGVNLALLFDRFDRETASFEAVAAALGPGARILHLVVDKGSGVATHQAYVHYPALAALRSGGIPSFSLALDPSYPVHYRPGAKPPAPAWEWRPEQFTWDQHGHWYDHFLVRGGGSKERLFGAHAADVEEIARKDKWILYRRVGR